MYMKRIFILLMLVLSTGYLSAQEPAKPSKLGIGVIYFPQQLCNKF